jgi:hypothetical protein
LVTILQAILFWPKQLKLVRIPNVDKALPLKQLLDMRFGCAPTKVSTISVELNIQES